MEKRKNKTRLARAAMTLLFALLATVGAWAETVTFDFEDNQIPGDWTNDDNYPWVVVSESQGNGHTGTYCIKSGNSGVSSSMSSIEATFTFVGDGSISFLGGCWGEGSSTAWDKCIFYIDGVEKFSYGARDTWETYSFEVEAGEHTFKWSFTKDSSVNGTGDAFFIDDLVVDLGSVSACSKPTGLSVELTPGNGTVASLSWTENGSATAWQICLNNDETNLIDATSNPYTLENLTPEQIYTAKVRACCDAENQSSWSNVVTFTPTNAYTFTVNDGTSTNGYVPIYGYYTDDITKSQFIIPAATLEDMAYGTIKKLTFYSSNASISWGDAQFEVYMAETEATTLSVLVDYTTMQQVKSAGSLSISGNKMEVTLDNPYQYQGGNLMIGFLQTVKGTYQSCNWYGVQASGASMGGYASSVNQQNFLPKTTFEYSPGLAPTCPKPTNLTAGTPDAHSVELSWTEKGEADQWQICINGEESNLIAVKENPFTLTNLDPETAYSVKVRAYCSAEDQSSWSAPVIFTTAEACPKPTNLAETNITTNSADLSWEGDHDSYVLRLRPWTPAGDDVLPTATMTTYTFDLSNYSGTGAVAIRHYDVTNMFRLIVDDIVVKNAGGTVVYSQDFEASGGNMPSEFSTIDLDGDGYEWGVVDNDQSYVNGYYGLSSASWVSGVGALSPDNWIILSDIELGGSISFAARGQDASFAAENFCVYVSADEDMEEINVETTSYTAVNLTPNTPYSWQVAGISGDEQSSFVGSIFKTKDDALIFATEGNWNELSNWTDAEGDPINALPTIDNRVRIDANVTIPSGVTAYTKKANLNGGTITIEDGGQLKHNSTVDVILKKEIDAAHYYLIATPLTTTEITQVQDGWAHVNVLDGNYDLYAFDSTADLEWINDESSSNHSEFTSGSNENVLSNQRGYLYANESQTTLKYEGSTAWSSYQSVVTADVTYASSSDPFNGWKLIGNPFSCNGYVSYSGDATFYKMNATGDGFVAYENGVELAPGEGAFIKVSASGTITYSSEAPEGFTSTSTTAAGILPILPLHGLTTNVDANGEDILFAKEGYATYYNGEYDVVLPAGMKAHVVTDGSTNLTYAEVADGDTDGGNVVPAGTAVLLQVEPSTKAQTLPVYLATPSAAAYAGTNLLFGSDKATETTGGAKYYKLTYSNDNANFGWYWGAANGAAFTSPAHKAWLALPASSSAPFLGLPGWEDTTGIVPVGVDSENGEWYTLQGLKIGKKPTTKGVYIHNGRKVVIK